MLLYVATHKMLKGKSVCLGDLGRLPFASAHLSLGLGQPLPFHAQADLPIKKLPNGNGVFHDLQANYLIRIRLCIGGNRMPQKDSKGGVGRGHSQEQ